ncbi:VOC family protein [Sphingopyxis sp. OPL5]|uniref:VOC family protein n=1 Tax=unclassified Sphingopyxis TaxID=2614943 RepID=UPI0006F99F3F|nr:MULTISPECIES: VOC family protein [unclassified Sphingopyxis]KQZ65556.1 lactoylglutathione lyase [Sphingopyxis sp. Root1497]QNO29207.1 VOC family protein [Sphingopyxis sp. OPL5]
MYSHTTLGIDDFARAEPFYDAIMAVLGHPELVRESAAKGYGTPTGPKLFIGPAYDRQPTSAGNGSHLAFVAADRATVDAFHAAALANGGSDAGPPGLRPHYHADYYGAYVRDPEGNKLQAVCHKRPG